MKPVKWAPAFDVDTVQSVSNKRIWHEICARHALWSRLSAEVRHTVCAHLIVYKLRSVYIERTFRYDPSDDFDEMLTRVREIGEYKIAFDQP